MAASRGRLSNRVLAERVAGQYATLPVLRQVHGTGVGFSDVANLQGSPAASGLKRGAALNLGKILAELKSERDSINHAVARLAKIKSIKQKCTVIRARRGGMTPAVEGDCRRR
jgi:hypothetical protein